MSNENQAVVKQDAGIPAHLIKDNNADLGVDGIEQEDIVIPRIKICQALSVEKKENKDLGDGTIYSNMGDIIGKKMAFIPLLFWKSTTYFLNQKMIASEVRDPKTKEITSFGSNTAVIGLSDDDLAKEKVKKIDAHNYFVVTEKQLSLALKKGVLPIPSIYSGGSAAIKYCRQLNGKLKTNSMKRMPIYSQVITMDPKLDKFDEGEAYMPRFSFGRYTTVEEEKILVDLMRSASEFMSKTEAHIEEETPKAQPQAAPHGTPEPPVEGDASAETMNMFDEEE